MVDGVFRSIGRVLLAFAAFPPSAADNLARWIRCEGSEYFEEALRRGRGVLFATAHLGNWELSAFAHALFRGPCAWWSGRSTTRSSTAWWSAAAGSPATSPSSRRDSARGILKALAANQAVGILIDQNATADSGVFVDFFGMPACAGTGFAKIAAHSGATVIPGFALWSEQERRYVLRFYPPVEIMGDAARDTAALQARMEEVIRAFPDQWLWIHRRWKTPQPEES